MLKNRKKYVVCIISLLMMIMLFVFSNSSKAAETKEKFTDDTIITKENIFEVLEELQVEYETIEKNDDLYVEEYTMKDLKNALQQNDFCKYECIEDEEYMTLNSEENEVGFSTKKDSFINKRLTKTSKKDGYELEYFVDVKYNKTKKKYVEITNYGVDVDGNTPLLTYKIGKTSLSSSCTPDMVTLKGSVNVEVYIGVGGLGLLKIRQYTIKSTYHW